MSILRTPDDRFVDLPDFPFAPHYTEVGGLRVHYIDEGQGDQTILCLHGEPTWSYLYRKMIPPFAAAHRVLAMDFTGFGRSDKLTDAKEYSFIFHRNILNGFIKNLELRQITLVVQDWGGLIGLTVATDMSDRFARLVVMNTGLPTGDEPASEASLRWRRFAEKTPDMPIGRVIMGGLAHPENIRQEVVAAYEAPFPDASFKAGASIWPLLVPLRPSDPGADEMRRTRSLLSTWAKPALVLFSDSDPITRGGDDFFRKLIPTAKDQPHIVIQDAGHFLQEEKGEELARNILEFIERTPID